MNITDTHRDPVPKWLHILRCGANMSLGQPYFAHNRNYICKVGTGGPANGLRSQAQVLSQTSLPLERCDPPVCRLRGNWEEGGRTDLNT